MYHQIPAILTAQLTCMAFHPLFQGIGLCVLRKLRQFAYIIKLCCPFLPLKTVLVKSGCFSAAFSFICKRK